MDNSACLLTRFLAAPGGRVQLDVATGGPAGLSHRYI